MKANSTPAAAPRSLAVTNTIRDDGQDIAGTINGMLANGVGRQISINTDALNWN